LAGDGSGQRTERTVLQSSQAFAPIPSCFLCFIYAASQSPFGCHPNFSDILDTKLLEQVLSIFFPSGLHSPLKKLIYNYGALITYKEDNEKRWPMFLSPSVINFHLEHDSQTLGSP
jgi:hypothetical protein